jgi:ubiquitin carboxyl-terminal hydrolase 9/24
VQDNVHGIIAAAASKFSLAQFELLNRLIKEKWAECNDRSREKLLLLIGQIGKEAVNSKQVKPVQAILQLLWDMAHIPEIPKHLVERAFAEHLATINEMTLNKDAIRRQYVLNCVDDIKRTTHCVLPAVKQLYAICKSYSGKAMSMYNKANKATLGELNKQHEIVKLLSTSLNKSHAKGVEVSKKLGLALKPDTMVDGRYTHREYVEAHLELMMFLLKEGDLYLSWSRCKELWETLVDNPQAIQMDQDSIFVWFTKCLSDLEPETQKELFNQKLLSLSPSLTTQKSFSCLKAYFESVNVFDQRLKKSPSPSHVVERTELSGLSHFWDILTDSPREEIAALAIETVLNMSYLHVAPRLKKEPATLHHKFIRNCYSRLEVCRSNGTSHDAVLEGCELETSTSEMASTSAAVASTTKTLTAISVSKVPGLTLSLPSKGLKLQKIRRLLLLAEKYILSIEVLFDGQRTILPHGASFFGRPLTILVRVETPKREEFKVASHTNESVGEVKLRIAERMKMSVAKLSLVSAGPTGKDEEEVGLEDGKGTDGRLVCQVGHCEGQTWQVKGSGSSSSTAVVVYEGDTSTSAVSSSQGASSSFGATDKVSSGRQAFELERERSLPGVLMAEEGKIFSLLYQLAELDDSPTMAGIRRLIHLIPTDSDITDGLDTVGYSNPPVAAGASPKMSPRINKKMRLPRSDDTLEKLFDTTATGMTPFRVLYNLEVLSSRIMPSQGPLPGHASKFAEDFLTAGGLRILTNVLEKDALPPDVDYDIRQSAYFIALQLAGYLLCGQTVMVPQVIPTLPSLPTSSPLPRPTPPKKSALDCSGDVPKSPLVLTASKCVQTMVESEFVDLISCLMRVVWAAAAGKLYLASMGIQAAPKPEKVYIGRRSRDSSTGSSTGSDTSSVDQVLHAGVCAQQSSISSLDCQIAGEALELFVTCLTLRQNLISRFYSLPSVSDFIIDTLLGSPSETVRQQAADQFARLSRIKLVSRALSMSNGSPSPSTNSPRYFLVQLLLKTPVPLWMPSCKARTASHQMTSQCGEYMDLRCSLLQGMSRAEQEVLGENAAQMIEDEITWLFNFSPCSSTADSTLLAGHIKLVRALLSCQGVNKEEVGAGLIQQFLSTYLFPASRLISEGGLATAPAAKDCSPQCDTAESRAAAYGLLVELSRDCPANLRLIALELVALHHTYDANMVKEHQFEYEPAIERRASCNLVGLKNAGATCYMNSVIQQLYAVPGVTEQLLGVEIEEQEEESVFYQLQAVFGHLLESKLQYFVPDKFWKCFKLWGQVRQAVCLGLVLLYLPRSP